MPFESCPPIYSRCIWCGVFRLPHTEHSKCEGGPTHAFKMLERARNEVVPGVRVYGSQRARSIGIAMLRRQGWNYFVNFLEKNGLAIQYSHATWVPPGQVHVVR
jgi:hypothetical protein